MKHTYTLSFWGTIEDVEGEGGVADTLVEAETAIKDSFVPDLLAGVKLQGMSIHIDASNDQAK
jgi:hypothetical protein